MGQQDIAGADVPERLVQQLLVGVLVTGQFIAQKTRRRPTDMRIAAALGGGYQAGRGLATRRAKQRQGLDAGDLGETVLGLLNLRAVLRGRPFKALPGLRAL